MMINHINKNHWTLLFLNMKAQAVMYIYSNGENKITSEKVLYNWKKYCFTRDRLKKMKWITASYKHYAEAH